MYNFSYWAEYEKVLHKSQKEIQGDARSHRYHTFIGEGELERLLKGGSICNRPGNFKDEGGSRKFEKGMVILEKKMCSDEHRQQPPSDTEGLGEI